MFSFSISRLFLLLFFIPFLSYSQGQYQRTKQIGDAFFKVRHYSASIPYYKKCLQIAGDRDSVVYHLAFCYVQTNRNKEALKAYQFLLQEHPERDTLHYLMGEMYRKLGRYSDAKKQFGMYLPKSIHQRQVVDRIASCDSSLKWRKQPHQYKIENLNKINSSYSDISPTCTNNRLVFASDREEIIIRKKDGYSGAPSYDFYTSEKDVDSIWQKPVLFAHGLNTTAHETSCSFSLDGLKFYFARAKADKDNATRIKMYLAHYSKNAWGDIRQFLFNDSLYSFAHPYIEPKEQLLFFASDMAGGYGGTDLYVCLNDSGKWSNPINLGPEVNTSGNETYPFYFSDEEKLYFSSDGHFGMGGQDIFCAEQNEGDWVRVVNLKPPINSSSDDFGIFLKGRKQGFFSSNREGGKGKEDIYHFSTFK